MYISTLPLNSDENWDVTDIKRVTCGMGKMHPKATPKHLRKIVLKPETWLKNKLMWMERRAVKSQR